jgi:hypothetical protein
VRIGRYCKLESECYITAYSTLEDRVFVAPGVVTSNDNYVGRTAERFKHFKGVRVKKGGRIGAGSIVLPGITIGEDGWWRRLGRDARRSARTIVLSPQKWRRCRWELLETGLSAAAAAGRRRIYKRHAGRQR